MSVQSVSLILCLFLTEIVAEAGVQFVMDRNPNNYFCGNLQCAADITDCDHEVASFVDMTVYDITRVNSELKVASVSRLKPDLYVDTTKSSALSCTGVISRHQANLTVQLRHDIDCLYGVFKCQLNLVTVSGHIDVVTEIVIPDQNNSNYFRIADMSARVDRLEALLGDQSIRANTHTAELKHLANIVDNKLLPLIEQTSRAFNCSLRPELNWTEPPEIQDNRSSTPTTQTVAPPCTLGWYQYGDVCVNFNNTMLSWFDALTKCIEYGARLVEVENQQKNDWIVNQLKNLKWNHLWIGGRVGYSGVWEWIPSFKKINGYFNWGSGQPDRPASEHCLHICGSIGYKWNDRSCLNTNPFACEKSVAV